MIARTNAQTAGSLFLRRILLGNAAFSGIGGLLLIINAGPLAAFLGIRLPAVLALIGAVLLGYAAWLLRTTTQDLLGSRPARVAVVLDVSWVLGSILILVVGWPPLTPGGRLALAAVADIVALFALLQFIGVRKLR